MQELTQTGEEREMATATKSENLATRRRASGSATAKRSPRGAAQQLTLLELIESVTDCTDDDKEVVATVIRMLGSGAVTLRGNFRGEPASRFRDS